MKNIQTVRRIFALVCLLLFGLSGAESVVGDSPHHPSVEDTNLAGKYWDDRFAVRGIDGYARALALQGDELYVAGSFSRIGDVVAQNIAKYDGQAWSALAQQVSGDIHTIAADGAGIVVGGKSLQAGAVANDCLIRWDGESWSGLGIPASDECEIRAVIRFGDDLYAGGSFSSLGGVNVKNIARWNGTAWTALGEGVDHWVFDIAVNGSDVYVRVSGEGVMKWDGQQWSSVNCSSSFGGHVDAVAFMGGDLYIAGGDEADWGRAFLSKWDGENCTSIVEWENLNEAVDFTVTDNQLVGGFRRTYDYVDRSTIYSYDGSTMSHIGTVNGDLYALAAENDAIYAGGFFTQIDATFSPGLGRRMNGSWSNIIAEGSMGLGQGSSVKAIAVQSGAAYVAGEIGSAGDNLIANIVKWDGDGWVDIPGPPSYGWIKELAFNRHSLYAVETGDYEIHEQYTDYIYMWDGGTWTLVARLDGAWPFYWPVAGMVVDKDRLYIATSAHSILVREDTSWHNIGTVVGNVCCEFAVVGDILYAGGKFSSIGGVETQNLAAWDGAHWSSPGAVEGRVYALAAHKGSLYVGGKFKRAGGVGARNVARWDGQAWSSLGAGVKGKVSALAFQGETVIVGGDFENAGGVEAKNIARWRIDVNNPAKGRWAALGSGTNGPVSELGVLGDQVLVGGNFTEAGGKPSYRFGIWDNPMPEPPTLIAPPNNASGTSTRVVMDWSDVDGATKYLVEVREQSKVGTLVVSASTGESQYETPELKAQTKYVWRVRACKKANCGRWTKRWKFTVK